MENNSQDDFEILKNKGNEQFKLKDYHKAINYYTSAIKVKNDEAVAYSNRAMCYIILKRYFEAKEDCDKAISLDPTLVKAYYRRATVMKKLLRFEEAINDFQKLASLDASFVQAQKELQELRDLIKEDKRIELEPMTKPEEFRSDTPIKMFNLNNHYYAEKAYGPS